MSEQTKSLGRVTLKKVRLAFPELWTPTSMKPDQPKQFGATFLMEKGGVNQKNVEAAIKAVAKSKWGKDADDALDLIEGDTQLMCFIDGDHKKKKKLDGYSGNWSLVAKNRQRPRTGRTENGEVVPVTEADGVLYGGCYVNAIVEIWPQDNAHGKAIRATLLAVSFHSKGDAFGGGRSATDDELADLAVDEDEEAASMGV